jgi:hypothetical protein
MIQLPKVTTFYPKDRLDILDKLNELVLVDTDPLNANYKDIDWNQFEAISVYGDETLVEGFSVAWHRSNYYDKGSVRILSRYWKAPSIRLDTTLTKLANDHIIDMVTQQIALCKAIGFTNAFISREKSPRYFNKLINNIAEKTNTHWTIHKDKQCVCHPDAPSCWQYKAEIDI